VLKAAVWELEEVLALDWSRRSQVCLRLDAGFGTDENLDWVLNRDYQVIAKSNSGRRAGAWGQRVAEWIELVPGQRWIAQPREQLSFCRPTRTLAVRWRDYAHEKLKHALYVVTDLDSSLPHLAHQYDLRGGFEVDLREDKQGLRLTQRRKRAWLAQEMLVLLSDLAHNVLSAFSRQVLSGTPLAGFGPQRLIQDVFTMPGEAIFMADQLVELRLQQTHPYAEILAACLPRLWT
jgi:hypothetical protein